MSKGKGTSLRSIELETFKWELLTHLLLITCLRRDDFWGSMKTSFMLAQCPSCKNSFWNMMPVWSLLCISTSFFSSACTPKLVEILVEPLSTFFLNFRRCPVIFHINFGLFSSIITHFEGIRCFITLEKFNDSNWHLKYYDRDWVRNQTYNTE